MYAFEDEVDPFALALTNRNIPKTLSENVIPKPSEAHVWFNGGWIKNSDAPKNYEQPTSSIPTYNPAWVVFLQPYTAVLVTPRDKLEVTLEQINSNSYDNDKLSKVVMSLPLSETGLQAFVTYDGAVSIPRNDQFPTNELAITGFNRILCSILLGGMHVEVVSPSELYSGTLLNGTDIFLHNPTIQGNLRHKLTPITDRMLPLMHPPIYLPIYLIIYLLKYLPIYLLKYLPRYLLIYLLFEIYIIVHLTALVIVDIPAHVPAHVPVRSPAYLFAQIPAQIHAQIPANIPAF